MKRLALIFALLTLPAAAFAQIDPTVEVSRNYDVRLQDVDKPENPLSYDDSLNRFDVSFDYSIFNRPYRDLYDFTPYETVQLSTVGRNRTPVFYAKLGTQYPWIPNGEIYLQTKPKNGFCAGLYGLHNSFWGGTALGRYDAVADTRRMNNALGGAFTYDWSTGSIIFDIKDRYDRYAYDIPHNPLSSAHETSPFLGTLLHSNNAFSASANISSANEEDNSVYYDITLLYRNTAKNAGFAADSAVSLSENFLNVSGFVGATFDIHRVYVDMDIEHASYSGCRNFSAGIVEFSPIYQLERDRLDARIGVKFGSRYGIGDAGYVEQSGQLAAKSNIFPDIDIRLELLRDNLWAHAVIGGGNDLNPYSRLMSKCPLLMPDSELLFGTRPLDASFAFESVIGGRLGINVGGSYVIGRNRMIFRPCDNPENIAASIRTDYVDANTLAARTEFFWQSQDLTLGGSMTLSKHFRPEEKTIVTELPKLTGDAYLRYSLRERFIAQADLRCTGSTSGVSYGGIPYEIPAAVALDINLNYLINRHFSVFAKCGNLLDRKNFYVPFYAEPGRNFGGGVCVSF